MVSIIKQYIRVRAAHLRECGMSEAEALFPNFLGKTEFYSANRFNQIMHKIEVASGVDFKLKDFRSTLTTVTINGDMSRVIGMSAQLRHTDPNTTLKFYNSIDHGVASKKLKDLWREAPVTVPKKPSIENHFEISGYG